MCACFGFPQGDGCNRDADPDRRQQARPSARPGHPAPQRLGLGAQELEVWLCGVLGQVQLAHFAAVRWGFAERGLCPLQTRAHHCTLSESAEERALRSHVRCQLVTFEKKPSYSCDNEPGLPSSQGILSWMFHWGEMYPLFTQTAFWCQEESSDAACSGNLPTETSQRWLKPQKSALKSRCWNANNVFMLGVL